MRTGFIASLSVACCMHGADAIKVNLEQQPASDLAFLEDLSLLNADSGADYEGASDPSAMFSEEAIAAMEAEFAGAVQQEATKEAAVAAEIV